MKHVLAFNASPRKTGNTSHLLDRFTAGAESGGAETEVIRPDEIDLEFCTGCLRCNVLKRCSISGDSWSDLAEKILQADILVVAAPVYFHHLPAAMKKVIDRFRSFIHVQITETGLRHTPRQTWKKDFVLILTMGSPDPSEAAPVIDLFRFMTSMLGQGNSLHVITATRLAVVRQVIRSEEELEKLYGKLELPPRLAAGDYERNQQLLEECEELAKKLTITLRL